MKPKVGEVWVDYTYIHARKCTIIEVYRDVTGPSVKFRFFPPEDDRIRDWSLKDFLMDAVLDEEYIVTEILTKYTTK